METKHTYLLVNFFSFLFPFLFSFHPLLKFYKHFGAFIKANLIVATMFIIWDIYFTHLGIWGFNSTYIMGVKVFNLPLEEVLFFICIPFACLFTIHCFESFFAFRWKLQSEKILVIGLSIFLLVIGLLNITKAYTASTSIILCVLLLFLKFYARVIWLPIFFSIFPVILIPFFIVNGILTGTGIENPVVWYNDLENLGIRMLTIPVEDAFYGMALLLLNYYFYNRFKKTNVLIA